MAEEAKEQKPAKDEKAVSKAPEKIEVPKTEEVKLSKDEKEKQELLQKGKVSLIIDSYSDIFSDFDSRDFSKRALSDDFIREARKIAVDVQDKNIELRFLIPKPVKKQEDEKIIKKKLKDHFKKHFRVLEAETNGINRNAIVLSVAGFGMMLGATLIRTLEITGLIAIVALVVLEPAGWFSLWFGLDQIFYASKEKKHELAFYRKMSRAEIVFEEY